MNKIELIIAEIEQQRNHNHEKEIEAWDKNDVEYAFYYQGKRKMCEILLSFIDSLPEDPSEDERIRKAISAAICGTTAETVLEANGTNLSDALAYLERQKNQMMKEDKQ